MSDIRDGALNSVQSGIERIEVDLGERSYDIEIGDDVLSSVGEKISGLFPNSRAVIVTDQNVDALHGATVRDSLDSAGIAHQTVCVPAGEPSKNFKTLENGR